MDKAIYWIGLFYTPSLTWVRVSDGVTARVGLTQQICGYLKSIDSTGSIQYRLKPIGMRVKQMEPLGFIDVKKVSFEIASPISGTIRAYNNAVLNDPAALYEDPEAKWIVELEAENIEEEVRHLLSSHDYRELCRNLWYFLRIRM